MTEGLGGGTALLDEAAGTRRRRVVELPVERAPMPRRAPMRSRRGRHPLLGRVVIGAFLAALFGAAALAALGDGGQRAADQRAELVAYGEAVEPLVDKAGEVVARGLRAGVDDIHDSRYDDETLRNMTRAWVSDLRRIHKGFDGLDPPAFLNEAHGLYLESMERYVGVAETLAAAVEAGGQRRIDLVLRAAHLGERADAVYDRADALVDERRRRLQLPAETPVSEREGAPRA